MARDEGDDPQGHPLQSNQSPPFYGKWLNSTPGRSDLPQGQEVGDEGKRNVKEEARHGRSPL
jgi:hypothetical protein